MEIIMLFLIFGSSVIETVDPRGVLRAHIQLHQSLILVDKTFPRIKKTHQAARRAMFKGDGGM